MERRSFLRGMLLSAAGGTAAVKLTDAGLLVPNHEVLIGHPVGDFHAFEGLDLGQIVYLKHAVGEGFYPIGILTELHRSTEAVDASSWRSEGTILIQGITTA